MSDNVCKVRGREAADLPVLSSVLRRVHATDGYPVEGVQDPLRWLDHPGALQSWTAEMEGLPIGQVTLAQAVSGDDAAQIWLDKTGGHLSDLAVIARLFVDPDRRHMGVGQMLMKAAINYARSLGRGIALDVMSKDRAAIRLYENLGGCQIGNTVHSYGDGLTEPAVVFDFPHPTQPSA